jgi:energy-coupling factor transporter ATP-binding protein EcfA2
VLLYDPILPNLGRVRDLLAVARQIRAEAPRETWLSALCIDTLLDQQVATLDRRQRRSVALALALAIENPSLVVLHEPLAELVGCSATTLRDMLRKKADNGTTVLILTASSQDAAELADDVATLAHGRIDRPIGAPDVEELCPGSLAQLLVWSTNPRLLASSLALDPTIRSVSLSSDHPSAPVLVCAETADACGTAVGAIALGNDVQVTAMRIVLPTTDEITAASAGLALGARYQAALHHSANARNGYGK